MIARFVDMQIHAVGRAKVSHRAEHATVLPGEQVNRECEREDCQCDNNGEM